MDTRMMDHAYGYGLVSRLFHWTMALLILYQVFTATLHVFFDDTAITDFFFPWHFSNGILLLCLTVLRGLWGLLNLSRRPAHNHGIHRLAAAGHVAMYVLLILIPTLGLVRAYGSTHPLSALGMDIFAARDTKIEWMTNLGNQWHGVLGWTLFALIAGHIVLAFVHSYVWKQPMIARMTRGHELP